MIVEVKPEGLDELEEKSQSSFGKGDWFKRKTRILVS